MKVLKLHCILFLGAMALMTSCQSKKVDPALQNLMDEVMEIHDEVMPKMGDIHKLKKKMRKEAKNFTPEDKESNVIAKHIALLQNADDGMMDWMKEYKKLSKLDETTDPMKYYQTEKRKISKVKVDMLTAIKNAQDYLKQ